MTISSDAGGERTATLDPAPSGTIDLRENRLDERTDVLIVRLGLASLLIVNALVALIEPESFRSLVTGNLVGERFPDGLVNTLVLGAAVNDAALACALVFSERRRLVYLWLASWFFVIALVKVLTLIS